MHKIAGAKCEQMDWIGKAKGDRINLQKYLPHRHYPRFLYLEMV